MDESDAPLLAAWQRFVGSDVAPFTIPGHKRRAGRLWPALGELLASDVPLFAGLGTMKDAVATLTAAEGLGAELWDADWCRYSTGGSTHVNQVAALAVGRPGQPVLVSRNAHRSTLSGLILAGLDPVWLPSDVDPRFGLPSGLSLGALDDALREHPDAAAVFCVEPSYVGTLSDLAAVVETAHARGIPVVVDQAWGGHFGFHPDFPKHALQAGADLMITSAHKALPAYSQAALIVARTVRVDAGRLDRAFDALATTSPAGSILASIDASRALLASPMVGELLGQLARLVADARTRLRPLGLTAPGPDEFAPGRFDPAKLVLLLDRADGNVLERSLIASDVPVEHADRDTLIAMVTMLDDEQTIDRLCTAIAAGIEHAATEQRARAAGWSPPAPEVAIAPRAAFFAPHETVPAAHASGRVSAELIAPYPPGIPLLAPGERITAETLAALTSALDGGVRIAYARDPQLRSYLVVVE